MSAFREAVAEWNRRFTTEGYRSAPAPEDLECPKCHQPRQIVLTTIAGTTRAFCSCCSHAWVIE